MGLTWVVVEWASLCDCTPAPGLETPTRAGAAAFPMGFADRRRPRHRPLPTPPPVPTSLFPSRPPGSGPVLVSPQTGCSWSLSAWRPSSSSSCWASAGVSAAPIPAAATSGAPAARKSAAAPRPVSTLTRRTPTPTQRLSCCPEAREYPSPAARPLPLSVCPGPKGRRRPSACLLGQCHSGGHEGSSLGKSGPRRTCYFTLSFTSTLHLLFYFSFISSLSF